MGFLDKLKSAKSWYNKGSKMVIKLLKFIQILIFHGIVED